MSDAAQSEVAHITRRAGVVALFTMLSRVFGAVRDIVLFHMYGASAATDAFFIAFTIPNVFRRLVAEGALTIAFIPVYSETREREGLQAAQHLSDTVFTLLFLFVGALVALGCVFASALVMLFASGFSDHPAQLALTTTLTRWMFPYLFFISGVALCMGVLNAHKHFAAPAAAPVLLNVCIVGGALASDLFDPPILGVAIGVLAGGLAQLLLQVPFMMRRGLIPRPSLDVAQPAVRKLLRLMVPAVFGLAVYQVNIIVLRQLASFLPEGHISYYYNADRLMELALGVFAIAIATAALPSLSDQAARKDHVGMLRTFTDSFSLTNFVTVPAAVGLVLLGEPIVSVLYLHGRFDAADVAYTTRALLAFAPGLLAIAAVRVIVQTFYALGDTRTPVEVAFVILFVNTTVGMILVGPYEVAGLAATLSLSSAAQAGLLLMLLRRRLGPMGLRRVVVAGLQQLAASAGMGVGVWGVAQLGTWGLGPRSLANIAVLGLAIAGGVALYLGLSHLLGSREIGVLLDALNRRRRR
ncbi:MAG: murein biosynthesis integral membrane protein MurJ [Pseudomonadota bacterium]